jgi:glycosyltransferase involved in cell wall biosynthesis
MADLARREMRENPRYLWHGSVPHARALQELARSRVMVLTSKAEGGPAAISESLACRVPILATRIDASVGLLGEEYPGLFPVGDHVELARLLTQCENDKSYVRKLQRACDRRRPLVDPEFERAAWKSLLESLGLTAH